MLHGAGMTVQQHDLCYGGMPLPVKHKEGETGVRHMTPYLIDTHTSEIEFHRTPLGPATATGFVRGLWIDPAAPASYPHSRPQNAQR